MSTLQGIVADQMCGTRCVSCSPVDTRGTETKDLNCSGTTNCQTDDDQTCTDVGRMPLLDVEGQCAGQLNLMLNEATLVLVDKAIREYPFTQVRYRLQSQQLLAADEIETAIEEYRKFLMVIAHTDGPVGMISPKIDEVWHAFILYTPEYMAFTNKVFGTYLHHQPNTPDSPSSQDGVTNFLKVYNKLFGELNPIWRSHLSSNEMSDCHTCENLCGLQGDCDQTQ